MASVKCSGCDKTLKGANNAAGKRVKCSACGEGTQIPEADAEQAAEDELDLNGLDSFEQLASRRKVKAAKKSKPKRKRLVLTDADIKLLKMFRPIAAWMGWIALVFGLLTFAAFLFPRERPYTDPQAEAKLVRIAMIYGFSVAALGLATVLKQGWALVLLSLIVTFLTYVNIVRWHFGLAAFTGGLAAISWFGAVMAVSLYIRRVPTTTKP